MVPARSQVARSELAGVLDVLASSRSAMVTPLINGGTPPADPLPSPGRGIAPGGPASLEA